MLGFRAWIVCILIGIQGGNAAVAGSDQDEPIKATAIPPGSSQVLRLSLENAQRLALTNNTTLTMGRLSVQEKSIAADAARRDYFPKLLGNFNYFHFNDNLGKVATFRTGQLGILPPGIQTIEANVVNQNSTDQRGMQIALASSNVRATIEKVRLEAVQAFVGYEQAKQAFGLAGEMVKARQDAELVPKDAPALAAAKAATAKSELELIQAEIAYRVAHARLIGVIGEP